MKKIISSVLALVLLISALTVFSSCSKQIEIAIPNDTTNEARALLLLQNAGIIKVDGTKGLTATVKDITENPKNIKFIEVEAAQIPNKLKDVDYAVINTNYALAAGLNPAKDALSVEGSASAYGNILSVKAGNEQTPKTLALKAALESKQVADYITEQYKGSVISIVDNPGNGYDASVDYEALKGTTITVAASPTPHAEILAVAKTILADKGITLEIKEFQDYDQPNEVVESGEIDANYFQHVPYMNSFNSEKGTHIVSVSAIHVEPMGVYGGKQSDLKAIKD
ncbi:MAG: hypothetical protein IJU52_09375 [Clostridia bacterium]|nr:hypothetical protein [Clostridia bacterium]